MVDGYAPLPGTVRRFAQQSGLADAGLTADDQDPGAVVDRAVEQACDAPLFLLATVQSDVGHAHPRVSMFSARSR
jgi:hypothetical protein